MALLVGVFVDAAGKSLFIGVARTGATCRNQFVDAVVFEAVSTDPCLEVINLHLKIAKKLIKADPTKQTHAIKITSHTMFRACFPLTTPPISYLCPFVHSPHIFLTKPVGEPPT